MNLINPSPWRIHQDLFLCRWSSLFPRSDERRTPAGAAGAAEAGAAPWKSCCCSKINSGEKMLLTSTCSIFIHQSAGGGDTCLSLMARTLDRKKAAELVWMIHSLEQSKLNISPSWQRNELLHFFIKWNLRSERGPDFKEQVWIYTKKCILFLI